MDGMIEMKDMQEEGFEDEEAGMELSSNGPVGNGNGRGSSYRPVLETDKVAEFQSDGPAEPGSWLRRRLRKQNRYMVILMGVLVIATVIFVAGKVYMSEDDVDSLVQPFDRESGTVENGAENEKQQQAINKANNNAQDQSNKHWNGNDNPFASKMNALHQQNNNHAHGNNHKGAIGNFGHNGHKRPGGGKFGPHQNGDDNSSGGGGGGNQNGDSGSGAANNKSGSDTDASTPSPSQSPVATVDENEKDVYCEDLPRYQKWYDTPVSKEDGPQFRVINKYDHDKRAFTQGLTYARGQLFESTGLYGKSTVRILDPNTLDVLQKVPMDDALFGEGMTYYKDTLVQITWKSQKGFIYNMTTLQTIDRFQFSSTKNQGWGITWNNNCKGEDELIMTDGSHFLHIWDPDTMAQKRKIPVIRQNGKKALQLNEIEFWRGRVLANVWYEDVLLVIHPETGQVEKEYDFSTLWPSSKRSKFGADVFNGISVSEDPNVLYVTGKNWDRMFTVELLPDLE